MEFCHILSFGVLSPFEFWIFFFTIWVFKGDNLSVSVLWQFGFLSCVTIWCFEFCHNLTIWVLSQFNFYVKIWLFFFSFVTILVFEFVTIWVLDLCKFEFLSFVTIWLFEFCHNLNFVFCHMLSFWVFWQLEFCHYLTLTKF